MRKSCNIFVLAVGIVVISGCATRDAGPGAEQTPAQALHPATGYAYPLEQPTAEEQAGVSLRFNFTKALRYKDEVLGDSSVGKRKSGEFDKRSDVTFMPTENSDLFIKKIGSDSQEWNSRGSLLKIIPGVAKNNVTTAVEDTGFLPESPVKIGDTWIQHLSRESTNIAIGLTATLNANTSWKFVGVTIVRTHRCVVLEGNEVAQDMSEDPTGIRDIEKTARNVCYFDQHLGGIVESAYISNTDIKVSLTKSKRVIDRKAQGQDILTLVE